MRITRVGVRQAASQQEESEASLRVAVLGARRQKGDVDLADPVGKPAHDVDRNNCEHQIRDFSMRSLLLLRLVFWSDLPQLTNDEKVEEQYQDEGYKKAERERVQSERFLSIHDVAFGPINVARNCVWKFPCVRVHEDWHH